jgi:hypothetical protein
MLLLLLLLLLAGAAAQCTLCGTAIRATTYLAAGCCKRTRNNTSVCH